uniref:Putative product n=1 Tax=Xenopsylla cheopis TaxID=163159 RepID=A0A6M2E2C7_XENCH
MTFSIPFWVSFLTVCQILEGSVFMWASQAFHWFLRCSFTCLEMSLATSDFVLAQTFLGAFFMSILRSMNSGSAVDFVFSILLRFGMDVSAALAIISVRCAVARSISLAVAMGMVWSTELLMDRNCVQSAAP